MLLLPKMGRLGSEGSRVVLDVCDLLSGVLAANDQGFDNQAQVVVAQGQAFESDDELFGIHYGFSPGRMVSSSLLSLVWLRLIWSLC